jgi:predicted outer membrane lipoprotein
VIDVQLTPSDLLHQSLRAHPAIEPVSDGTKQLQTAWNMPPSLAIQYSNYSSWIIGDILGCAFVVVLAKYEQVCKWASRTHKHI